MFNLFKRKGIMKSNGVSIISCNGMISINGQDYVGNNVQINGDKIIIDGVVQNEGKSLVGQVNITIHGNVDSVTTTTGQVSADTIGSVNTTSGDINCLNIRGNVNSVSGDVECSGAIGGSIRTISGDIIGGGK